MEGIVRVAALLALYITSACLWRVKICSIFWLLPDDVENSNDSIATIFLQPHELTSCAL